jgi:hypothetical protein
MIKSTVEKMANPIGFEIGASDDITQAELWILMTMNQ